MLPSACTVPGTVVMKIYIIALLRLEEIDF